MLDLRFIRENADLVKDGARKKRIDVDIDALIRLDAEVRSRSHRGDEIRSDLKTQGKAIAALPAEERSQAGERLAELKAELKEGDERLKTLKEELRNLHLRVPNLPAPEVPEGVDDADNLELRKQGDPPAFDFEPLDHVELGKRLGLLDVERGVKIAGTRNYFLTGDGALLERAVMNLALDMLSERGFVPLSVPVLVRYPAMEGTAYFPGGEDQAYVCEKDDLYLAGTAEVPITSFHSDEILASEELPKKYVAWSYCFRREAGAAGKDSRGVYRIHQFQKVEQVVICPADYEASDQYHREILQNSEDLLQRLELPYRVVEVCGGDLGAPQHRKYDIETWMPSRGKYSETHSASSFHDFQARRLKLRYRDGKNTRFCFTLNNTVAASPRILIPLMECHQRKDGTVHIPLALRRYMGGREVIGA